MNLATQDDHESFLFAIRNAAKNHAFAMKQHAWIKELEYEREITIQSEQALRAGVDVGDIKAAIRKGRREGMEEGAE